MPRHWRTLALRHSADWESRVRAIIRLQARRSSVYAIVRAGGRQEKVAVGDLIELDRRAGEPGSSVSLPVLLLVDGEEVIHGSERLSKAAVAAEIVDHHRGPKIDIGKFKNKTGYRRRQGHRQELTTLMITSIDAGK